VAGWAILPAAAAGPCSQAVEPPAAWADPDVEPPLEGAEPDEAVNQREAICLHEGKPCKPGITWLAANGNGAIGMPWLTRVITQAAN
jgi:hypothetical protein